jgi:hypothetical protein
MHASLQRSFATLETGRAALYKKISAREVLLVTNIWTPAQLLEHLALAEERLLGYVDFAAAEKKRPTRSPLLPILLWAMRRHLSLPVPDTMMPSEDVTIEDAAAHWATVRERLQAVLDDVADPKDTAIAIHPQAGPLSAAQIVAILEAHQLYHQKGLEQ